MRSNSTPQINIGLISLLLAAILIACGGGGGDEAPEQEAPTGSTETAVETETSGSSKNIEPETQTAPSEAQPEKPQDSLEETQPPANESPKSDGPELEDIELILNQPIASAIEFLINGSSFRLDAGENRLLATNVVVAGGKLRLSISEQPAYPQPACSIETSEVNEFDPDDPKISVNCPEAEGLQVSGSANTLLAGEFLSYTANLAFSQQNQVGATAYCDWTSSDIDVARVVGSGLVEGISAGMAIIQASCFGFSEELTVLVTEPTLIALEQVEPNLSLSLGEEIDVLIYGRFDDGSLRQLSDVVTWSIADSDIATMDGATVSGLMEGSTSLTAEFNSLQFRFQVNVANISVQEVQISPVLARMAVGQSLEFYSTAIYSNRTFADRSTQTTWEVGDAQIIDVDESGRVSALSPGTTTLTASFGGQSTATMITVLGKVAESLEIVWPLAALPVDASQELQALVHYSDGSRLEVSEGLLWSFDRYTHATLSSGAGRPSQIRGVSQGEVTVQLSYAGLSSQRTVQISGSTIQDVSLVPEAFLLAEGQRQRIDLLSTFSGGEQVSTPQDCIWSVSGSEARVYLDTDNQLYLESQYSGSRTINRSVDFDCYGLSSSANLILSPGSPSELIINPEVGSVALGSTEQLQAILKFNDGASVDVTNHTTWLSSDRSRLSVGNGPSAGGLTALAAGPATVTANYSGFEVSADFSATEHNANFVTLGTGLTGNYFNGKNLSASQLKGTRIDAQVKFDWSRGQAPLGVGDYFSVRWTGKIRAKSSELYTFWTRSDDGIRVWVNGVLVLNEWSLHAPRWDRADVTIALEKDQLYDIRVVFFENAGHAVAELYWQTNTIPREEVATEFLYPE